MLKSQRIQKIKEYVNAHQTVSLDKLMEEFQVSKNTIRRDVQYLVRNEELKKVYGGVSTIHSELIPYTERADKNQSKKQKIAELAATFIKNGDVIFLDSGTTTSELIPFIKHLDLTIVTNNITIIVECLAYENLTVFSTGGMLERKTNSFAGFKSLELLKSYNINKAFMAATGISISNGVTNSSPSESSIKTTVVDRSSEVFLLVDDSKFDRYALTTYCDLKTIPMIITNEEPNEHYMTYGKEHGVTFLYD